MALSGSYTSNKYSSNYSMVFDWVVSSQDVESNSSTVDWTLTFKANSTYGAHSSCSEDFADTINVYVDENRYTFLLTEDWSVAGGGSKVLGSGTTVVYHESVDSQPFTFSFDTTWELTIESINRLNFGWNITVETGVIDNIVRAAYIVNVTPENPSDEDNFVITYSNPAGEFATELQACISFTGGNDDIPYRDVSKTGTSYTFILTENEKNTLYGKLNEGLTSIVVRFYLRSRVPVLDGSTYETVWDYKERTINFVNYTPTLDPYVEDINSDTLALTGDSSILVRYMSEAWFRTGAQARKGASVQSQYITNGDIEIVDTPEGSIPNITSNTFYFGVTDSRFGVLDNSKTTARDFIVKNAGTTFIKYVLPTCAIRTDPITPDGKLKIYLSGKYFEGSFGDAVNRLWLDYQIYKAGQTGTWTLVEVQPTVDENNNYTAEYTVTGLQYDARYTLVVRVVDQLNTSAEQSGIVTAQPLFDWDKDDFKFYIPVELGGGFTYPQTVLWQGTAQMGDGETITLDYPVSEQPTGIVLVFSLYRNDAAENVSIHSFFKSKAEIKYLLPGAKHTFMMGINSNLSIFGSKYLTITDTQITGFSGNTATGTAQCGITFDNTKFVLRYVIGV